MSLLQYHCPACGYAVAEAGYQDLPDDLSTLRCPGCAGPVEIDRAIA